MHAHLTGRCNWSDSVLFTSLSPQTDTILNYKEGDLRLIAGIDNSSGRVEIYHEGNWGTICNDEWDIKDAGVACRQLGFKDAYAVGGSDLFGRGFDQIWLDNLNCTGEEESLSNCSNLGWGVHNCNHAEDAGVFCTSELPYQDKLKFICIFVQYIWTCVC